jgi:drug/metabolite transporter (DMT)-like permease
MLRSIITGTIAGAAGELALNVVTYADMLLRARPASRMPVTVAARLTDAAGIELAQPGERADKAENRHEAIGALLGYGMAVATAVASVFVRRAGLRLPAPIAGLLIGGTAMAISDSIATALGATDPKRWRGSDWIADIVPHAVYGIVTASTVQYLEHGDR